MSVSKSVVELPKVTKNQMLIMIIIHDTTQSQNLHLTLNNEWRNQGVGIVMKYILHEINKLLNITMIYTKL